MRCCVVSFGLDGVSHCRNKHWPHVFLLFRCWQDTFEPKNERMRKGTQQLLEIRSGSGQDGVDRVSDETFQKAAFHAIVALKMTNFWFNRTASFAAFPVRSRECAGAASRTMHGGLTRVIAAWQ